VGTGDWVLGIGDWALKRDRVDKEEGEDKEEIYTIIPPFPQSPVPTPFLVKNCNPKSQI